MLNNQNPQQAPKTHPVGLAIIAFLVACTVMPLPMVLVIVFFGLLIAITLGVWKIAKRP